MVTKKIDSQTKFVLQRLVLHVCVHIKVVINVLNWVNCVIYFTQLNSSKGWIGCQNMFTRHRNKYTFYF